jgi:hypothetical protein
MSKALALVRAWLVLDFFGDARRDGKGHARTSAKALFIASPWRAALRTPP